MWLVQITLKLYDMNLLSVPAFVVIYKTVFVNAPFVEYLTVFNVLLYIYIYIYIYVCVCVCVLPSMWKY